MAAKTLRIAIVGAGPVGTQLGLAFHRHQMTVTAVISHSARIARRLADLLDCEVHGEKIHLAQNANVVVLCVPDGSLPKLAREVSRVPFSNSEVTLVHTAGIESHEILKAAKANGFSRIHTASMHPIQSFPRFNAGIRKDLVTGIFFGIEGELEGLRMIRRIIKQIRAFHIRVPSDQKVTYHAGAVIVSNFFVALLAESVFLYEQLGLSEKEAMTVLMPLICQTIDHARLLGPGRALTGPAVRGDKQTLQKHVSELAVHDPQFLSAYKELTKMCQRLAIHLKPKDR